MQIDRNRIDNTFTIHMKSYIDNILNHFCMHNCNERIVPCEYRSTYSKAMCPVAKEDIDYMMNVPYSKL